MLGLTPISGSPICSLKLPRATALLARLRATPRHQTRLDSAVRYRGTIRTVPSDAAAQRGTN